MFYCGESTYLFWNAVTHLSNVKSELTKNIDTFSYGVLFLFELITVLLLDYNLEFTVIRASWELFNAVSYLDVEKKSPLAFVVAKQYQLLCRHIPDNEKLDSRHWINQFNLGNELWQVGSHLFFPPVTPVGTFPCLTTRNMLICWGILQKLYTQCIHLITNIHISVS